MINDNAGPPPSGHNIVFNGGFETTPSLSRDSGIWDIFTAGEVPGWSGTDGIKIQPHRRHRMSERLDMWLVAARIDRIEG